MSHNDEPIGIDDGAMDRRLPATAALNVAITVAEFLGGILSGSLALLSDAAQYERGCGVRTSRAPGPMEPGRSRGMKPPRPHGKAVRSPGGSS